MINLPSPKTALMPTYTGNVVLDTAINQVIIVVAGFVSALLVAWMSNHGIGANYLLGIPAFVPAFLTSVVALGFAVWSVQRSRIKRDMIVSHSLEAAVTGVVPAEVKMLATTAQRAEIAAAGK